MTEGEAIHAACADVGIVPPKRHAYGRWISTDTLGGRNGKGDGRLIVNDTHVTAWNWQTGETKTIGLGDAHTAADREHVKREIEQARAEKRQRAARAAKIAEAIVGAALPKHHAYLATKGFAEERALVIGKEHVCRVGGDYLGHDGGREAIVIPARIGSRIASAQLIWEDGSKKFLFGGAIAGATHRVATGTDTWLCEGFATGLTIRKALRGLGLSTTVLCCLSASNIEAVAGAIKGRCFIAADNDEPREQFGGVGAGEFYARKAGRPFVMSAPVGSDFNDECTAAGIFAVQRRLTEFVRREGKGR